MKSLFPSTLQPYKSATQCCFAFCHGFVIGVASLFLRLFLVALWRFWPTTLCHSSPFVLTLVLFALLRLLLVFLILHFLLSCVWTIFCEAFIGHYLITRSRSASQSFQNYFGACFLFGHIFFGFFALESFICSPTARMFDHVLSVSDVGVYSHSNPSFISVHLCHTKTDIVGVGRTVYLGWVEGSVCPVKAILAYLALRGPFPGPLIIFKDKSPLSRLNLVRA